MAKVTIHWMRLAVTVGVALCLLAAAGVCLLVFLLASVVAYGALCMGLKVAAAVVFALGCGPLAALCVVAMAFWNDRRCERMRKLTSSSTGLLP